MTDLDVPVSQDLTAGADKAIATEVKPRPGDTTAVAFVQSTDIEGGPS